MVQKGLPSELRAVLWDLDPDSLDSKADSEAIMPRVLEHGGIREIEILIDLYGLERLHRFLREVAHPLVSERTRRFWRAFFRAGRESWATTPSWRQSSAAPWID
jgi:hypothetical protein